MIKDQDEDDLGKIAEREQKNFSFETLAAATKNFHPSHKLGEGGFGPVYQVQMLLLKVINGMHECLIFGYLKTCTVLEFVGLKL